MSIFARTSRKRIVLNSGSAHRGSRHHDLLWRHNDHEMVASAGAANGQKSQVQDTSGTITVLPSGHEARWDIARSIEVSHIYLPQTRVQNCADILAKGKRVELLYRVDFEDPADARIMQLLSGEAEIG